MLWLKERRIHMNCDKFRENISYYIDDILDDNDKSAFENHMNNCEKCKCEYEQMIILIDSLNSVEQVPLPDNYDETLRNKLKNEKVKDKRKWSKYMYIAASLAIVFFSVQNIDKFERIDIQENSNIEISENANKDVQQSPSAISDSENAKDENNNVEKRDIVDRVSDNEKTNTDVQQSLSAISGSENTEGENDNVEKHDSVDRVSDNEKTNTSVPTSVEDQKPIENIEVVQNEKDENNMMSIQMTSDEPLQKNSKSIAQFSMNNEYQKNIKVGDAFDIMLENSKGTKYSMIYEDENGLIELISKSISEGEEIYSSTWGFRASKEGTINIIYILHNENDENDVYDEIVYEINIQE
jgi:hypothetical protein